MRAIWRWSFDRFGASQADRHLGRWYDAMHRCAIAPDAGRILDGVPGEYRVVVVGSHLIVYRPDEHGVVVRRVLHGHMDMDEHLDDDEDDDDLD